MLSNEFKTAVLNGDVLSVKIMIKDSILLDTSGRMTDEMLHYAEENHLKILEGYDKDSGELVLEPEKWDRDVLDLGLVELMGNFSRFRIEKLKKMAQKLYPQKVTEDTTLDPKTSKRIDKLRDIERQANAIAQLAENAIKKEEEGSMRSAENLIGPEVKMLDKKTIKGAVLTILSDIMNWKLNK